MAHRAHHGLGFSAAERANSICLDVLDAWFPPAPAVSEAYRRAENRLQLSPDLDGESLVTAISMAYDLPNKCIGIGAGSSEIIHRVFGASLGDSLLLLDPTYSEYRHIAAHRGSKVTALPLTEKNDFRVDLNQLIDLGASATDVVIVNPNNPTGRCLTRDEILQLRASLPAETRLWIDEAYVDYCPDSVSVQRDAITKTNLFVIKSLSKGFALSGLRVAYWVGSNANSFSCPPWIVNQPATDCAITALASLDYYRPLWKQTIDRAAQFADQLRNLKLATHHGYLNSVLIRNPEGMTSKQFVKSLSAHGITVRTPAGMGQALGDDYIRISLPRPSDESEVLARVEAALGIANCVAMI